MVETSSVLSINLIFRLFDLILKKVKKDSLKQELAKSLEIPIKIAEQSLENLNFSLYTYFGAGVLGNIIEPTSPKETAQKIVDNIDTNYSEFIHNFKELSKYFDAHMGEFREILNRKEILILEAFVKACEGDIPDYNFLMKHGATRTQVSKEIRRKKTFNNELNQRLGKKIKKNANLSALSNAIRTEEITVQQLVFETMTRIVMEKQFSLSGT